MKKRVTFTVDEDVFENLQQVPRGISVSEMVSFFLKLFIEGVKPYGMTPEEFAKHYVKSGERNADVYKLLQEKLNPFFDAVDREVASVKGIVRKNKIKKKR